MSVLFVPGIMFSSVKWIYYGFMSSGKNEAFMSHLLNTFHPGKLLFLLHPNPLNSSVKTKTKSKLQKEFCNVIQRMLVLRRETDNWLVHLAHKIIFWLKLIAFRIGICAY